MIARKNESRNLELIALNIPLARLIFTSTARDGLLGLARDWVVVIHACRAALSSSDLRRLGYGCALTSPRPS
jgi:hypothetical protein